MFFRDVRAQQTYQQAMQVLTQGAVTAMTLNVFATALGLIVVASGALEVPPAKLVAADPAINELRKAFGNSVVDRALADVPDAEAIKLAQRVEYYVHQDLRKKYGDWATERAIEGAPPGDMRTAIVIAETLSARGVTPASPVVEKAKAVATGRAKGRALAKPVKDTKTGVVYPSEYKAGLALASEYKIVAGPYSYWKIKSMDPGRLEHV